MTSKFWCVLFLFFFFSSRRRHTRLVSDLSSDVCSSDLGFNAEAIGGPKRAVAVGHAQKVLADAQFPPRPIHPIGGSQHRALPSPGDEAAIPVGNSLQDRKSVV